MSDPENIIRTLVDDLTPVKRPAFRRNAMIWWALATLVTGGAMAVIAPFRSSVFDQLGSSSRFMLEALLGLIVCASVARAAFELGIPDIRSHYRRARLELTLLSVWILLFMIALVAPIFEPSMAGKREYCYLEAFLYSVPVTIAGIIAVRNLMPLNRAITGASVGFAAGLIPAYLMQFACMHEAWHIVSHHIFPTVGAGLIGAVLGFFILRRTP